MSRFFESIEGGDSDKKGLTSNSKTEKFYLGDWGEVVSRATLRGHQEPVRVQERA